MEDTGETEEAKAEWVQREVVQMIVASEIRAAAVLQPKC